MQYQEKNQQLWCNQLVGNSYAMLWACFIKFQSSTTLLNQKQTYIDIRPLEHVCTRTTFDSQKPVQIGKVQPHSQNHKDITNPMTRGPDFYDLSMVNWRRFREVKKCRILQITI